MPVIPLPAATVILLREPYEVLMVRRSPELRFMGGFWVFPGGKVEAEDASIEAAARREVLEEVAITLAPETELVPCARWITPEALPRRFDTWFFLALDPGAGTIESPVVDGSEIVEARWVSPQEILSDNSPMAFPTRKQLELLAGYASAEAAITASRQLTVEPVLPVVVTDDGSPAVMLPGGEPEAAPELPVPEAP